MLPKEGATGWADTWMVDAKSPHPNCAYLWMNWVTNPDVQAQIAEWFGEAPANTKACALTTDPTHCDTFHAEDEELLHEDLVLVDAAVRLPGRSHGREVHPVRRVGQGVEQHQERLTWA